MDRTLTSGLLEKTPASPLVLELVRVVSDLHWRLTSLLKAIRSVYSSTTRSISGAGTFPSAASS
jgi:hypothetical protein